MRSARNHLLLVEDLLTIRFVATIGLLLTHSVVVWADHGAVLTAFEDGDYGAAVTQYRPLADAGKRDAQYHLGVMYHQGWGVIADPETAAKWYEKAARQGSAKAQHNLAHLLQLGEGVARAPEEAVRWYLRAANQGSAKSAHRLGLAYYQGDDVQRDYARALRWWERAFSEGEVDAGYNVGIMYHRGLACCTTLAGRLTVGAMPLRRDLGWRKTHLVQLI